MAINSYFEHSSEFPDIEKVTRKQVIMNIKIVTLALSSLIVSSQVLADEWTYQLEPYLMVTSIKGDASVGRVPNVDVDVDFGTILDNLESAAMIHFEAHHDSGWGMMFDYGYMDLGNKTTNDNGSFVNAEVRQGVLELQGMYRNKLANGYLDYFAGIRWWDNDLELEVDIENLPGNGLLQEVKSDWVDPVVGVRWLRHLDENWTFLAQADVGGFGVESDFTSSVHTGVQYQVSDLMTLNVKYKGTWVDFKEGSKGMPGYFQYDTITHGPVIGLIFNF
jgi:hypothetical protein